jgi:oxygen-independent coproporphyrinogen-3 oxidase
VRKCGYCDFYSVADGEDLFERYVRALKAELARARAELGPLTLWSVYLGGGTPTVLPVELLAELLEHCGSLFGISPEAEITCECNPGTVGGQGLARLRATGANRLSVGAQSFLDEELRFLERVHTAEEARRAVLDAREAGFGNLSLDLIYCLPGQSREAWQATLNEAVALGPGHISAYCLQVEEGTPLAARVDAGEVEPMPDDEQADLYGVTAEALRVAGFEQYEISNYAQPGFVCRHNLTYWHNEPYVGVGAGAWSFVDGERRQNVADVEGYIAGMEAGEPRIAYRERCTGAQAANETLMMGLRLCEGIDLRAFTKRHGLGLAQERRGLIERLCAEGLATNGGGRLALTAAGMAIAAEITAALAFAEEGVDAAAAKGHREAPT